MTGIIRYAGSTKVRAVADPGFDLDAFFALPRLTNLHVSPDGGRLAVTVHSVAQDGKRFAGAVWEIPTSGDAAPRRLTRSARGETARGYLADGSLLFTSARPYPEPAAAAASSPSDGDGAEALYILPAGGGEPRRLLAPGAGVGEVITCRGSTTVVATVAMHPATADFAEDGEREKTRRDAEVSARLVDVYPDRYWDHDIGPRAPRLFALDVAGGEGDADMPVVRDLTPAPPWPGWLEEMAYALSEDGTHLAFGCSPNYAGRYKADLALIDVGGTESFRVLIDVDESHGALAWSPDGATIAVSSADMGRPDAPMRFHLRLVDAGTGAVKDLVPDWEGSAQEIVWTRDGQALLVAAEERGHVAVFRIDLSGGMTRLTRTGAYRNLALSPDGDTLYAIRAHVNESPLPVALDVNKADQEPRPLRSPVPAARTGTRLEEVTATADDGTEVQSWLVLPEGAATDPLPLAVLIHGGPFSSWTGWPWRWSPALLAAQGWAVLLPNPRLSTGFGHHFVASAWGDWATLPSGDILASVDAALTRSDIDASRTAALGGSYGGYMANWLAVTTTRFRAIVTHASVWNLQVERDASDLGYMLDREFGDPDRSEEAWRRQSPHARSGALGTPMLVIHGARDQRVPLGNSHSLFAQLQLRGIPSRMLVYPDENHWILKPQNSRLWYETVMAFLAEHVLGTGWHRPELV
jgi:dipeptidyl aminopeptidase/acylaminoacyl peptidase